MPFQVKAKVITNTEVAKGYFRMTLAASRIAAQAQPGQFVQLRVACAAYPLLRRPFSIHRVRQGRIDILYEVVGEATRLLCEKHSGDMLDSIGPLGNGFLPGSHAHGKSVSLLVAGGMGVAPLLFLAERLVAAGRRQDRGKPLVLLGAKTRARIVCEKEFSRLGSTVMVVTDDGSRGSKGYVSELLSKVLSGIDCPALVSVYACGPRPMLKAVAAVCGRHRLPLQVSLEEHMACGIGACLGCAVETKQGLQRVCKEGPVFEAGDIIW